MGQSHSGGVSLKEVSKRSTVRDTRSAFTRFREDIASKPQAAAIIGGLIIAISFTIPVISHFLPIIAVLYYFLTSYSEPTARPPIMLPIGANQIDDHNYIAGRDSAGKMADGVVFLGNDRERNMAEVWVNVDISLRHEDGFGTTGSGKTEFLLAKNMSVLCQSASIIDVDGKAAADTARKIQYLVRRFGREDDIFYSNFMTAGLGANKYYRTSNNTNPLSTANPQAAYQFLSQFIAGDNGSNKIFAERAAMVADITTNILYDRQDNDPDYTVSFGDYAKAMQMSELLGCLKKPWLTDKTRKSVVSYLQGLNIDSPEDTDPKNLKQTELDQHLYASMYFARSLNSITGTYGYIFGPRYGDFNWFDAFNRHRIIKAMVPSLEKSDQERDYLVGLTIAMLKQTASKFLDFKIAGTASYTKSLPHDNSLSLILFDEANYLLTEGVGMMAGQLRSMRFSLGLWGQSLSALRTRNSKEMEEVEGNTGLKYYGALEDMGAIDDAIKRASQVRVDVSENLDGDRRRGYYQSEGGRQELRDVLTVADIKGQRLSEWTLLYKELTIKLKSFYAPELNNIPDETRINEFCHPHDDKDLPSWLKNKLRKGSAPKKLTNIPEFNFDEDTGETEIKPFSFSDHMKSVGNASSGIESMEELISARLMKELQKQRSEALADAVRGCTDDDLYDQFDSSESSALFFEQPSDDLID
jgi:hypothetical protein